MNLRYAPWLKYPRRLAKHTLSAAYPAVVKLWPLPEVRSIDETLDELLASHKSISRFGDGEFLYIIDRLNLPFQRQEPALRAKMIEILRSNDDRILVGLPIGYHSIKDLRPGSQLTWRSQIAWIYPRLRRYLEPGKVYYNASMTRPYADYADKSNSARYFAKLMKLWEGRKVLLVEGEKSRLGVGNDLFAKAGSVERILAPKHHAFSRYDDLLGEVRRHDRGKLVLIALGPTATAMAYDLAMEGYQAIDIGNVDIEYEWFRQGAAEKVKIHGKYTSEAKGGRDVDDVDDPVYESQIIARIL